MKINKNIKLDFPWFQKNKGWAYLDSGATSLKPKCVIDAIVDFYEKWSSNPHNTDSSLTYHVTTMIDTVRSKLAKLINADKEEIIFTSGATESLNLVSSGLAPILKKGDEIVLTYLEHTSNLLPWIELAKAKQCKIVYAGNPNQIPTETDIIKKVNKKTKIIAFANVSNLLGSELDAQIITKHARKIHSNILIVCDATQMLPHKLIDVKHADIDFLVASGHKMCSGTGVGMLYMKKKLMERMNPIRFGGGMNNNVYCDHYTFASGPDKFEGGSPHTAGIISWGAAIDYLNAYGWINIHQHDISLKKYINQEFSKLKNVELLNYHCEYPIAIFNVKGINAHDVANYLGHKKIIVRSGLSCAKLTTRIINQPSVVRASFYLYNDKSDVDKLITVLKNIKKGDVIEYVI